MAQEEAIKQFLATCETCTALSVDEIVRNPDWGKINFEESRKDIERLQAMLNHFKVLPLELLPDQAMNQLNQHAKPTETALNAFSDFTIEQENPTQVRNSLVQQLKGAVDQFYMTGHIWIPYLAYQRGDVQRNIDELSKSVKDANKLVEKTKSEIESKHSEINSIIGAAREASASVGVAHFTGDFTEEATNLSTAAKNWLIATGVLAGVTFVAAWIMIFNGIPSNATTAQVVQHATSKIVMLGLLFTATIWAGRIYKATMHQATVNKHRANALKTFQAFVKAADDDAARDAVLMETTRSIFALASSGYLDEPTTQQEGGVKIVEMVKSATDTVARAGK